MSDSPKTSRHSYPLALLLVIFTGCAVMAAVVAPVVRNFRFDDWFDNSRQLVGAGLATLLGGALLGMLIGLHQYRRVPGVVIGAIIGALIAPLAALLMTINRQSIGPVLQAVLIGCAIMVATAWFIRPPLRGDDEGEISEAPEVGDPFKRS